MKTLLFILCVIVASISLIATTGCDTTKVVAKAPVPTEKVVTLAEQQQCATAAKAWFNDNFGSAARDKTTQELNYSNHYNRKLHRCFVQAEWHVIYGSGQYATWFKHMYVYDAMENRLLAEFHESHTSQTVEVFGCDVQGTKCEGLNEFNQLSGRLMSE